MKKQYVVLFGFMVAMAVVHALVAAWTPIQGDDWLHWIWAGEHPEAHTGGWLASHFEFSDAMGYILARCRSFHIVVTPMVFVALVVGLFTLAMKRLPSATWDDILGLGLCSTLLWLGQPSAAVTFYYTASTAPLIYGSAIAVWFVVPFRCGWSPRAGWWPVLFLAGYLAGTSTRAIGLAALVGVIMALRRGPRARWMWIAFAGIAIGVLVGYAFPPWLEFPRVFRRAFDDNLKLFKLPFEEIGELISMTLAFYLLDFCLAAFGRPRAPIDRRPETKETVYWVLGFFLASVLCMFGPKYNETLLFPATCMILVGAMPWLTWLASSRPIRYLLVALVVFVHVAAWSISLVKYHRFGSEGRERLAIIQSTPPGGVANIPHYSQTLHSFWFLGEDLTLTRLRQLVAVQAFGLRSIQLDPYRRMELDPDVEMRLEVDNISAEDLAAAKPPLYWASDVVAARRQFELLMRRLRKYAKKPSARLVVTNIHMHDPRNRPIYVAYTDVRRMIPRVAHSNVNENSYYSVRIYGRQAYAFKQAFLVDGDSTTEVPYRDGSPQLRPASVRTQALVACNDDRCLLVDAFVPRL